LDSYGRQTLFVHSALSFFLSWSVSIRGTTLFTPLSCQFGPHPWCFPRIIPVRTYIKFRGSFQRGWELHTGRDAEFIAIIDVVLGFDVFFLAHFLGDCHWSRFLAVRPGLVASA